MYNLFEDNNGWYVLSDTDNVEHDGEQIDSFDESKDAWSKAEKLAKKAAKKQKMNACYTTHPSVPRAAIWTLRA